MPTLNVGENTYVDLATYETFLDEIIDGNPDADQATKERSLISAFNIFQTGQWQGTKTGSPQTAAWPRTGVECKGEQVDPNTVPVEIERGQMEYANLLISQSALASSPTGATNTGLKKAKAGSAEVQFFNSNENQGIDASRRYPTPVWELVGCFTEQSSLDSSDLASGLCGESSFDGDPYGLTKGYA